MFIAGALAPDTVRTPTAALSQRVVASLPFLAEEKPTAAKAEAAAKKGADALPLPIENLLLPTPLPAKGSYALQVGQFGPAEAADLVLKRVSAAGFAGVKIAVVDRAGQPWWIVAAGQFANPDEARTGRTHIAQEIGSTEEMPIILLPATP
jgi:hypothetical protein